MKTKSGSCYKFLVFLFNGSFLILGILLTTFASLVYTGSLDCADLLDTNLSGPSFVLILLGIVITVISFIGTCGSLKENYCLLMTFASVIGICCLLEVVTIGLLAYNSGQIEDVASRAIKGYVDTYNSSNHSRQLVDKIQQTFSCCGAYGIGDFEEFGVPSSCCEGNEDPCEDAFEKSCPEALSETFTENIDSLVFIIFIFLLLQMLPMIFALNQAWNTRKGYYRFV